MNIYGLTVFSKIWISLVSGFHQKNSINIFPVKKGKGLKQISKVKSFYSKDLKFVQLVN